MAQSILYPHTKKLVDELLEEVKILKVQLCSQPVHPVEELRYENRRLKAQVEALQQANQALTKENDKVSQE
ncbi:hypothetical protein MMYC01_210676, partial [Madurella mycetomatis]